MTPQKITPDRTGKEFYFLMLYRLRTLTAEEKREWFKSWGDIRRHLPEGIRLTTEATSAFGTEYTGFAVYEGPLEKYEELVEMLEEHSAGYVIKARTIIGTTGLSLPIAEIQKILEGRPVD